MAEQDLKQNNQRNPLQSKDASMSKENPLDVVASDKKSQSSTPQSAQSGDILKNQRLASNVQNSQQLAFNALFKTATTASSGTDQKTNTPAGKSQRSSRESRSSRSSRETTNNSGSAAEIREQIAVRTAVNTQRNTANTIAARAAANSQTGSVANIDQNSGSSLPEEQSLQHSGMTSIPSNTSELGTTQNNSVLPQNNPTPEAALANVALNPSSETIKLLDLVGPEAVLSFREALQQVWVNLDENASKDLDVIARMPATMTGMSAMELLMVESPQGIHFVAFLKNSNDFDVLATFDRRSLLPDSPSRQLIEAALMSYEQLDTVFKDGGQKIENKVKELAASRGTSDMVFQELQRLMVQEKRRRRKFRGMIDHLIDQLDMLDLSEDSAEASFVPNKDLSGISEGRLEQGLEDTEDLLPGLDPEDNDYH
jgi:hypothetical protein